MIPSTSDTPAGNTHAGKPAPAIADIIRSPDQHRKHSLTLRRQRRLNLSYLCLGCSLVVTVLYALSVGAVSLSGEQLWSGFWSNINQLDSPPLVNSSSSTSAQHALIIWEIRLPRILLAVFIGSALATCGVLTQGLFRNPLADPTLIGITAGASAGATLAIVLGLSLGTLLSALEATQSPIREVLWILQRTDDFLGVLGLTGVSLGAFLGALAAMVMIFLLERQGTRPAIGTLLMTGLALTAFVGGFTQLISNLVDDITLRQLSLWHMGGLQGATFAQCFIAAISALFVYLVGRRCATALDALALGESEAACLGIALSPLKRTLILTIATGIGLSVTLTGTIAFVGLVVPHIMRQCLGPGHRALLSTSCLAGALLLLLADTVARTMLAPTELPVGALTTLLGAPFFLCLLLRRRNTLLTY